MLHGNLRAGKSYLNLIAAAAAAAVVAYLTGKHTYILIRLQGRHKQRRII